jgi:hypothetical protein
VAARVAAVERVIERLKLVNSAARLDQSSIPDKRVRELAESENPGPYVKALATEVLRMREAIDALEVKSC